MEARLPMETGLPGWDGVSLHAGSPGVPVHAVAVLTMEASGGISHQRLRELVASRLARMARFRSRLVGKPLGLGQPVWGEIDRYDPTPQIHSTTVGSSNGGSEFAELIDQLAAREMDRRAPLWEAWTVDGLVGNRWALAVTVSPAVIDGIAEGVAAMWAQLLAPDQHGEPTNLVIVEAGPGALPSVGELIADTVLELWENSLLGAWLIATAMPAAVQAAGRLFFGGGPESPQGESSISAPASSTVFSAHLTARRAVGLASVKLSHLKAIAYAFGSSVSNVALTACALSLRTWLRHHDSPLDHPLVMEVPLSLFKADSTDASARVGFPVHSDDPVQVLLDLHAATDGLTADRQDTVVAGQAVDIGQLAALLPPSVVHAGMALSTRLPWRHGPTCHGVVSYVPGPSRESYCAGSRVVGMHTVTPLADGSGLGITLTRHGEVLDLAVCVCPDNVPGVQDLATGIVESVDILLAAAQQSPRGQGPSVITRLTQRAEHRRHLH